MSRLARPGWRLVALLLVLVLVGAACGDDDDEAETGATATTTAKLTGKALALAFVGPLTGDAANLGINIRNGAKVAVAEARKAGVNVELKEFDTQGDAAQATTLKDQFINDESIVGIVGPTFSGETKALIPPLEEAGLVMVTPSATGTQLPDTVPNGKVFHRIVPDDDVQGQGVADYVSKKLKAKTAGYVHDNSEYGKGLAETSAKLWELEGVRTAVIDAVDPKSQDFSAAVNKVKAANPDVVFYGGYYAEAGRFKKQLVDAGVEALFTSGDGALDGGFVESAGAPGAESAQITCACRLATSTSPGELGAFAKAYKELYDKEPGTYSTEGFDAANILIDGIKDGIGVNREGMLEHVEGLTSYEGLSKSVKFQANGNIGVGDVYVYEVKAGRITELGTTGELIGT